VTCWPPIVLLSAHHYSDRSRQVTINLNVSQNININITTKKFNFNEASTVQDLKTFLKGKYKELPSNIVLSPSCSLQQIFCNNSYSPSPFEKLADLQKVLFSY